MDRTETYIKMSDCEEIQSLKPDMGLIPPTNEDTFIGKYACFWAGDFDWVKQQSRYIWLPRQDDLQEMVPSEMCSTKPNFKMISELNHFFDYWDTNGIPNFLTTWEQLWLAFVMKEKYNKIWNGKEWILE